MTLNSLSRHGIICFLKSIFSTTQEHHPAKLFIKWNYPLFHSNFSLILNTLLLSLKNYPVVFEKSDSLVNAFQQRATLIRSSLWIINPSILILKFNLCREKTKIPACYFTIFLIRKMWIAKKTSKYQFNFYTFLSMYAGFFTQKKQDY